VTTESLWSGVRGLEALTHVQTKRGKVTLSYCELDVEQLGSLYEGLLERTVRGSRHGPNRRGGHCRLDRKIAGGTTYTEDSR
jgi:hypothetical protein